MNYLIIGKMRIALFLMVTCFLSCGPDQGSRTYIYTVRNESGVKVKIIGDIRPYEDHIINLTSEEELTRTYCDYSPPRGYDFSYFFGSSDGKWDADSIRIVYNDSKFKVFNGYNGYNGYNSSDRGNYLDARNPLGPNHRRGLQVTYTITKEDYENALDCDGNCE